LTGLTSAGSIAIDGNRKLPQCEVDWLAKRVNSPTPAGQNDPTGTCSL
jgi:hypothetical protein